MRRRHAIVFLAVLLVSAGCDQATKRIAVERLAGAAPVSLAGDVVRLELAANPGGFLSLGAQLPHAARRVLFVALVPAFVLLVCALVWRAGAPAAGSMVGLGLVAGGGLGNWLDRLLRDGFVTDFLSLNVGPLRTGIFNVADVAVLAGVALLLLARSGSRSEPPREVSA